MQRIIKKLKLNVDYQQYKIGEIIFFSIEKNEQREARDLYNSGIGTIVE